MLSPDSQRLLFCTDGRGGAGKHDLFIARRSGARWSAPERLAGPINTAADDFDAVFLSDGKTIVYASGDLEKDAVKLYVSAPSGAVYSAPLLLPELVNSKSFMNFGCAVDPSEPGVLYLTSSFPKNAAGRADIYRIRYRL